MKKRLAVLLTGIFLLTGMAPVAAAPAASGDGIESCKTPSIVLMDVKTGYVLYEKKADEKRYPASITKIMTAMCALDKLKLDEKITISDTAVNSLEEDAAVIGIEAGDEMNVEDALYALMLQSANEIANALAEEASGSIESFADYMNTRAKQIGCENTHFVNPSGLHDDDHYTTARDMALIVQEALKNEKFREIFCAKSYETMETTYGQQFSLTQHHEMVAGTGDVTYDYVKGGKTGYTSKAKNTLVTYAEDPQNRELLCVLLKSPSDDVAYEDTRKLLEYGYEDYDWSNVKSEEQIEAEKQAAASTQAAQTPEKTEEKKEEKGGFHFFGFLLKLLLVLAIGVGCYFGGKAYHEKLEREREKLRIRKPRE